MIKSENGTIIATGPRDTRLFALVTMKHAMRLELNTGLKMSRGMGPFQSAANHFGETRKLTKKVKQELLAKLEAYIEEKNAERLAENAAAAESGETPA